MSLTNDNAVGDENEVRCFHCDAFRANWKPGDDPLIDHDNFNTECPYRKTEQKQVTTEKVAPFPSTTIKRGMNIGPSQDAHEKQAQNQQRISQSDKNTDPSYPISTRTRTNHELPQSTSVANQSNLFASDPKKGKYTNEEDIDDENEGTVNGFSVSTTGENVCSNISDGAEHTNDSEMESGQMCDIGTIIAQDNMQPNGDAFNKPTLTVTNGSMTTNDKVCNITTLPLQQSDVADSKETCAIVALTIPNNNKAAKNEGVSRKYISDADVSDVSHPERNPSYAEANAHRETYRKWPSAADLNIESLVDAGFFSIGKEDIVRCFFCDIGLAEWNNDDDPWVEHARHSPDYPYLKNRKSDEFISAIQAKWLKVYSPRHPQYIDMMTRYETFASSWPRHFVLQSPKDLAAAGFFYTGTTDTVRCHYCDGGLRKWEPEDDPWVEHARWFPSCKFVLKIKGLNFVQAANTNVRLDSSHVQCIGHVQVDASFEEEDFEEQMLSSQAKEIGSYAVRSDATWSWENRAKLDQLGVLEVNNSSASLKNILNDDYDEVHMDSTHTPGPGMRIPHRMLDSIDDTEKAVLIYTRDGGNKDAINVSTDETSSGDRDKNIDTDPTFNSLRQENRRLKEQVKCKICHEEDISFVFIPCGHLVACIQCGEKALKCIDCNFIIKEKRKIHLV